MSHSPTDNSSRLGAEDAEGYAVGTSGPKPAKKCGVETNGGLTLHNTMVSKYMGIADGVSEAALGRGIGNLSGPFGHFSLVDSAVTRNQVAGSAGTAGQGAGVYNGIDGGATVGATNSLIACHSLPSELLAASSAGKRVSG